MSHTDIRKEQKMHLKIKTESKNALFFPSHNRNKSYEQAENKKDLSGSLGGWLTASNELCTLLLSGPREFSFWALAWPRDCVQKEGVWFLPSSFVRCNAKDNWGQQSLKLRLCKAAKTQVTGSRLRQSQHSHVPHLLCTAVSWDSPLTFLPRTQSVFGSH